MAERWPQVASGSAISLRSVPPLDTYRCPFGVAGHVRPVDLRPSPKVGHLGVLRVDHGVEARGELVAELTKLPGEALARVRCDSQKRKSGSVHLGQ